MTSPKYLLSGFYKAPLDLDRLFNPNNAVTPF